MRRPRWLGMLCAVCAAVTLSHATRALADDLTNDDAYRPRWRFTTPERFALELRGGPYQPNAGAAFDDFFGSDPGLLWAAELDYFVWSQRGIGHLGIGFGGGWAGYDGRATTESGTSTGESSTLTLIPLNLMGVYRLDVLDAQFGVPFVFAAKLGMDAIPWRTSTGNTRDASGISLGLRWALQVALRLDFLDRSAARTLDEDWGINHSQLFFEVFGSNAGYGGNSLKAGTPAAWTAGLAFIF
jgi:hypothetical protein